MFRICALACLASAWVSVAFAHPMRGAEPVAEIPYRIDYEGWVTVSVTVNGKGPFDFIVDTGATTTVAFENLAKLQAFTPADHEPIRILGLTSEQQLPAVLIGDLEIGGLGLDDHVSVVLNDWLTPRRTPHGVLGLDFLTRYLVLADADAQVLRLYDRAAEPAASTREWSRTTLRRDNYGQEAGALYRLTAQFNNKDVRCILDLGATGTVLNYPALRNLMTGIFVDGWRSRGFRTGTRLQDVFNDTERARLVKVHRVRIARARWRKQIFTVHNALIFYELGVGGRPYCLIGGDLMLERSFLLDFAREKLYFGPKARGARRRTGRAPIRDDYR